MKLETKFSCGDTVYRGYVADGRKKIPCKECGGRGRLKLEGKDYTVSCPPCNGSGGSYEWEGRPVAEAMTIGQVRVEFTQSAGDPDSMFDNYKPQSAYKESYMCIETGVGSGNVWDVERLFLTMEEAKAHAAAEHEAWIIRRAEEKRKEEEARAKRLADMEEEATP